MRRVAAADDLHVGCAAADPAHRRRPTRQSRVGCGAGCKVDFDRPSQQSRSPPGCPVRPWRGPAMPPLPARRRRRRPGAAGAVSRSATLVKVAVMDASPPPPSLWGGCRRPSLVGRRPPISAACLHLSRQPVYTCLKGLFTAVSRAWLHLSREPVHSCLESLFTPVSRASLHLPIYTCLESLFTPVSRACLHPPAPHPGPSPPACGRSVSASDSVPPGSLRQGPGPADQRRPRPAQAGARWWPRPPARSGPGPPDSVARSR